MKKAIFAIILLLAVTVAVAVAYFFIFRAPLYGNVRPVAHLSKLTIVLPSKLPANSEVVSGPEYDGQKKTIVTSFKIDGKEFVVSQQKRPDTSLDQIDAEDTFLVDTGSVYVLKGEPGRLQAIVETSDSWLLVNGDADIGVNVFKDLLQSLERV
ncbi:MAG TPA: hypothetical protein PL051_04920 [Candidatus Saccharibacteria bacterium]|nr:hypothetical protein [Candidatus Saccharibacteria bacterium]